ncbi:hypothetical protein ISS37_09280 [candidate division KSB1 bacterium]|nr:hypothetical protein [candidate division KSB1 bacterium]
MNSLVRHLAFLKILIMGGLLIPGMTLSFESPLVVLPFQNRTDQRDLDWLGWVLAERVSDYMGRLSPYEPVGQDTLKRVLREWGYEEFGLADLVPVIRVGDRFGAKKLVLTNIKSDKDGLLLESHLIDVLEARWVDTVLVSGAEADLFYLGKRLTLGILAKMGAPVDSADREGFLQEQITDYMVQKLYYQAREAAAQYDYDRALDNLEEALDVNPDFSQARKDYIVYWELASSKRVFDEIISKTRIREDMGQELGILAHQIIFGGIRVHVDSLKSVALWGYSDSLYAMQVFLTMTFPDTLKEHLNQQMEKLRGGKRADGSYRIADDDGLNVLFCRLLSVLQLKVVLVDSMGEVVREAFFNRQNCQPYFHPGIILPLGPDDKDLGWAQMMPICPDFDVFRILEKPVQFRVEFDRFGPDEVGRIERCLPAIVARKD